MEPMYHIGLDDSHGARYAILPGDPGRVEKIAQNLENPRFLHQNREYTTWIGTLSGEPVLVMSTGMGGPSTAIGVEELYRTGVHTMIRVGTCGGMAKQVVGGDLVIANGAIREPGEQGRDVCHGQRPDQQICRGLSGKTLLRRLRVCGCGGRPCTRACQEDVRL